MPENAFSSTWELSTPNSLPLENDSVKYMIYIKEGRELLYILKFLKGL